MSDVEDIILVTFDDRGCERVSHGVARTSLRTVVLPQETPHELGARRVDGVWVLAHDWSPQW